jgi:uncharacterized protein DUF5919
MKYLYDIYLPLLINLVAGILIFVFATNITNAFILLSIIEFLVIVYLLFRNYKEHIIPGVKKFSEKFENGYDVTEILEDVSSSFDFIGISARTMLINEIFIEKLLKKAKGKNKFRFLLLNPDCNNVDIKSSEEGDIKSSWENEINASIERLKSLKKEHKLNIEIRLYESYPIFRQIILNNTLMYFSWYPTGQRGTSSPVMCFDDSKKSIYQPLKANFEEIWKTSIQIQ